MDDFEFIDGYLDRIDLPMIPTVDPKGLALLQTSHLRHVPFENLDIMFNKVPLRLDTEGLYEKIVVNKRGGICYEQNMLFATVLERLGFNVRRMASHHPLMGRNQYDHMFLLVDFPTIEETWISDVGFGNNNLAPVKFVVGDWQSDMRDMLKIDTFGNGVYDLVRRDALGDEDVMYEFNLTSHVDTDYRPRCDSFSMDADSPFRQGPIISLDSIEGRITLSERHFKHWVGNEKVEEDITSADQFYQTLEEQFGIVLGDDYLQSDNAWHWGESGDKGL